jgi:hypothetical protein
VNKDQSRIYEQYTNLGINNTTRNMDSYQYPAKEYREAEEGTIYGTTKDPWDPKVLIKGYGVLKLSQIKKHVAEDLKEMLRKSRSGDDEFSNIGTIMDTTLRKVKAIIDVQKKLKPKPKPAQQPEAPITPPSQ